MNWHLTVSFEFKDQLKQGCQGFQGHIPSTFRNKQCYKEQDAKVS